MLITAFHADKGIVSKLCTNEVLSDQ